MVRSFRVLISILLFCGVIGGIVRGSQEEKRESSSSGGGTSTAADPRVAALSDEFVYSLPEEVLYLLLDDNDAGTQLENFLEEEESHDRLLQEDEEESSDESVSNEESASSDDEGPDDAAREYGERCNDDNPCVDGLVCMAVGGSVDVLLVGDIINHRRCMPDPTCLHQKLIEFESIHDISAIESLVFENAGITKSDLLETYSGYNNPKKFAQTTQYQSVMDSTRTILKEPARELLAIVRQCAHLEVLEDDATTTTAGKQIDSDAVGTCYIGFQVEAGAILEATCQFLYASQFDFDQSLVRVCGGLIAGANGDLSFLIGVGTDGDRPTTDLECVSINLKFEVGAGLNMGLKLGLHTNGLPLIEFAIGTGLGLAAGVTTCGAFGI